MCGRFRMALRYGRRETLRPTRCRWRPLETGTILMVGEYHLMAFNIVASCDNNFAQHTCVMLTSLLFHHPNQPFRIFLLVPPSFSEENRRKLIESLNFWAPEVEF